MQFIIVSGLSGAGKTITLHTLEDMGFYCVDNLPVTLLPAFAEQIQQLSTLYKGVAVGVDARTTSFSDLPSLLHNLSSLQVTYQVLFLEAEDEILIRRFSESRRKHPLTLGQVSLQEALQYERQLLAPLANQAYIIDTSHIHIHQLRDLIRLQVHAQASPSLLIQSFGFKFGLPREADFVFDVRCLPNPHWQAELRSLTGQDRAVIDFLQSQPKVQQMQDSIRHFLTDWLPESFNEDRNYLTVAIGCTGGRHRSVYLVEQLASHFKTNYAIVLVRHRELP